MKLTRRQFVKQVGIALGSLVATRCVRVTKTPAVTCYTVTPMTPTPTGARQDTPTPAVTCYTVVPMTPTPSASEPIAQQVQALNDITQSGDVDPETIRQAQAALARERLRAYWFDLDQLAKTPHQDWQEGEKLRGALAAEHRAVLDQLVTLGELEQEVAEQVQIAFEEAALHVWLSQPNVTCYVLLGARSE